MWKPPERIKHPLPPTFWPTTEQAECSRLFSPVQIGTITARQRTWVPAMVPWRASDQGQVTPAVVDWYRRFAAGKPGVIVLEATGIRDVPSGPLLRIGHERYLPGLRTIVEAVKEASEGETALFIQCIDFLAVRRRPTAEAYFGRYLVVTERHRAALAQVTGQARWQAASESQLRSALAQLEPELLTEVLSARELADFRFGYRERVTDTELAHIRELPEVLPELFADAAARAVEAGFDGVELHYAHAYTMASFLSALNERGDGYGGSREQRVRLPAEVVAAVRARVGSEPVVGARMLGAEVIAGGSDLADACFYAPRLVRAGLDFVSVSVGGKFEDAAQPSVGNAVYPYTGQSGYECMPTVYSDARGPFGRNVQYAAAVKAALRAAGCPVPVVTAGGIGTFELAEQILQRGNADIIGAARATLADPDWFLKARSGAGDQVRRCHYTNYCEALDQRHLPVTCKLWDRTLLDTPGILLDSSGRRRLVAPPWPKSL